MVSGGFCWDLLESASSGHTRSLLLALLRLLLLGTLVLLVRPRLLQLLVRTALLLRRRDGARLDPEGRALHGDDLLERVLRDVLELRLGRVALLHTLLAGLLREDEELRLVELQAVHVRLQALGAAVAAAVVHGDADRRRELRRDLRLLQLLQREALAEAQLHVVALRGRVHHGSQQPRGGPWGQARGLGLAVLAAALLAGGLVEPSPHHHAVHAAVHHAVDLAEVHIGDDMVARTCHLSLLATPCPSNESPAFCLAPAA